MILYLAGLLALLGFTAWADYHMDAEMALEVA